MITLIPQKQERSLDPSRHPGTKMIQLFAIAVATVAFGAPPHAAAQQTEAVTTSAQPGVEASLIAAHAYLEPYRSIEISSVESGVIEEIMVAEGDRVINGQELIKLDRTVMAAQLRTAEAQAAGKGRVMAAEADFELQRDRLEKLEALHRSGRANEAEIDKHRATTRSSEGLLLAAQEEVEIFKLSVERIKAEIERRVLTSPIDGVVVEIVKDVAEQVSTLRSQQGEADYLIRVVRLEELKMTAHLPYREAMRLKVGDTLPVVTEGDASSGEVRVLGVVEFISPIIKSATGTMAVRLRIDNTDLRLRGGTAARVLVKRAE